MSDKRISFFRVLFATADTLAAGAVAVSAVAAAATVVLRYWVWRSEFPRTSRAQRAEDDVKLMQLFTSLTPVANGYGQPFLSEEAVKALLSKGATIDKDTLAAAVTTSRLGAATMGATIRAIADLGLAHPVLRKPAEEAILGLYYLEENIELGTVYAEALGELRLGRRFSEAKQRRTERQHEEEEAAKKRAAQAKGSQTSFR